MTSSFRKVVVIDWDGTLADWIPTRNPDERDDRVEEPVQSDQPKAKGSLRGYSVGINTEGTEMPGRFYLRPNARRLLRILRREYRLVLWSYGVRDYIDRSLRAARLGRMFEDVLGREDTVLGIKDLCRVEADLTGVILVDDMAREFGVLTPHNCILVPGWQYTEQYDNVLVVLPQVIRGVFQWLDGRREELLHLRREIIAHLGLPLAE